MGQRWPSEAEIDSTAAGRNWPEYTMLSKIAQASHSLKVAQ